MVPVFALFYISTCSETKPLQVSVLEWFYSNNKYSKSLYLLLEKGFHSLLIDLQKLQAKSTA